MRRVPGLAALTRFWTGSIRRQLMLSVILVHVVLMSFFVFDLVERQRSFLHQESVEQARSLTNTLAANATSWTLANDVVGLNEVLQSLEGYPGLLYAMVLSPEGRVLAHTEQTYVGLYLKDAISRELLVMPAAPRTLVADDALIDIAIPIAAGQRQIGWARIGLGQQRQAASLKVVTRDGVLYALAAVVTGMLFAFLMARYVTGGLGKLVAVADQIRRGRRDVRTQLQRSDEIGKLAGDLNLMLDAVAASEEQLRLSAKVFEGSREGIVIADAQNRIISVNRAFTEITGYAIDEARGRNPSMLSSERHGADFYQAMWAAVVDHGYWQGEIWNRRKSGEVYPGWLAITAVKDPSGAVRNYIGIFSDITERKEADERISFLAQHDVLTGLPNRALLLDRLQQALSAASRSQQRVGVMFIDLDHFKTINDSLGHEIGDLVLQTVAHRLVACVRATDTVSRQGGDEFVVVFRDLRDEVDAAHLAQKILESLGQPYRVQGLELHTTPSIGITIYPQGGTDAADLIKNADAAMYHAKEAGRNNYQFYTEAMQSQAIERLSMENSLRRALDAQEFRLHYQPQIDLASGAVVGAEALLRWHHPEHGNIPPGKFIPVAEDSNLILPIGEWVLAEACRQNRAWQAAGLPAIPVAVNLSAVQFRQKNLADIVARVLTDSGLEPRYLELELTEGVLIQDTPSTLETVDRLKAMGVLLSIDDFGTGYSSLSYLKRFDVDKLKIDQSFVRDLPGDLDDAAIAQAVIGMAHGLRLLVIAEGVETAEQLEFLRRNGCDQVQGYYFSQPIPAQDMELMLARRGEVASTLGAN